MAGLTARRSVVDYALARRAALASVRSGHTTVADACDAMMSPRTYRPALEPEHIDAIMAQGAGSQWDAKIVENFLACRSDLYSIYQRGLGASVANAVDHVLERMHFGETVAGWPSPVPGNPVGCKKGGADRECR